MIDDAKIIALLASLPGLTRDEELHMQHAQRISFASGNVALTYDDATDAQLTEIHAAAKRAAGRCPCSPCRNGGATGGSRGAVKGSDVQNDPGWYRVPSGKLVSGEIKSR